MRKTLFVSKAILYFVPLLVLISGLSSIAHSQSRVAYAWGHNEAGQLGNGTRLDSPYAVPVPLFTDAVQVATGVEHSLLLRKDGTVWAWGGNTTGALGDGTYITKTSPTQVPDLTDVIQVAAGGSTSLALKKDGTVWAWGNNINGQLGINSADGNSPTPVQVNNLSDIVYISMGAYHGVAVKKDGTIWQWGLPLDTMYRSPVQVEGLDSVTQASCGTTFTLALKADGTVWAWGRNYQGQLGVGNTTQISRLPKQTQKLSGILQISAGEAHSLAVDGDHNVWAWGYNDQGQLGDGSKTTRFLPVQITKLTDIAQVSAGFKHSLALKKSGTVQSMGNLLGDGTWDSSTTPVDVVGLTGVAQVSAGGIFSVTLGAPVTPKDHSKTTALKRTFPETNPILLQSLTVIKGSTKAVVSGIVRFSIEGNLVGDALTDTHGTARIAIPPSYPPGSYTYQADFIGNTVYGASSGTATLTITPFNSKVPGTLFAWGDNVYGQQGDHTNLTSPLAHQILGLPKLAQVAGGLWHTLALGADGSLWSWGRNLNGQLGDGTLLDSNLPRSIKGITDIEQVSAGGWHSLALKFDGTVWAWGGNSVGQLGDGTNIDRNAPVAISGIVDVFQVSAGNSHSVALDANGMVWAWGYNFYGQLGDGSTTNRNSPTQIAGLTGIVQVSAGWFHTLALKSDGTVWAWGYNYKGQLGDGSNTDRNAPVPVIGLTQVLAVSAGSEHSLALKADGTVWAWGSNVHGQLGDGSNSDKNLPVQITALANITQVSAGWQHSLALNADGTIWAWGENGNGQLGDGTFLDKSSPLQVSYLQGQNLISAGGYHSLALLIQPRNSVLSLSNTKHPYAEPFTLDASLLQKQTTHPLKRKPIRFFVGSSSLGEGLTDKTGKASLLNPKLLPVGSYNVKARFDADLYFRASTSAATLNIVKANTKVTARSVTLAYGEKKPITATLFRSSDKANPAKMPIAFTLDDVALATVKTDANGVATLNYKLEEPTTAGKHTLKASFAGDANHNPSSITFTLTANKAGTHMTLPSVIAKAGETVTLNATLRRNTGGGLLVGRVVKFFVEGAEVGSGTTGSNGVATLSYTITQSVGKYKLKVSFEGDDFYLASTYEKAVLRVK